MAHVIARHAAIREDQARQAALVTRVVSDMVQRSADRARWRSPRSKIALASFSRAQEFEADGIGVGISARAGFDPYGAARFLTAMGRNAELQAGETSPIRARRNSCRRIRRRPSASQNAHAQCAAIFQRRRRRARPRGISAPASTASSMARIRAKASCAAGASCIRSSASPSPRPTASRSTTPRRRCSA